MKVLDQTGPTHLFEEVAGKRENVKEGGVSERRRDLPMFGQGVRGVGLRGETASAFRRHTEGRRGLEDQPD